MLEQFREIWDGFWEDFGMIFANFFEGLEGTSISETFQVEGLISMIRATRGTSRRPNHMRSQIGRPKALAPVNFRRLWGDSHSVAKQASLYIALGADFLRFRSDFSRFWEAKVDAKIDFWELFLQCFFRAHFGIDFGWFFRGSNL